MIKETITYTNVDGDKETIDAYFHLTKGDMVELAANGLGDKLSNIQELDSEEILDIFRLLVTKAYGRREEIDGHIVFTKDPNRTSVFMNSDAYGELLIGWLENPERASNFLTNLMPKELIEAAQKQQEAQAMKSDGATNAQIAQAMNVPQTPVVPMTANPNQVAWNPAGQAWGNVAR